MSVNSSTRPTGGQPFSQGERRTLRCGTTAVTAAPRGTQRHATHEARRYHVEMEGLSPLNVQFNDGQPAEDQVRLERIVEDVIAARSVRQEGA